MKNKLIVIVALAFSVVGVCAGMFDLGSFKMALWYDGEGDDRIEIMNVPRIHSNVGGDHATLVDDPFMISDRPTQDLNIVSLYQIKTGAELDGGFRPIKLYIDISKAKNTRNLGYTVKQVTEAAAICLRALFPKKTGVPLVVRDGTKETPIEPPDKPTTTIYPPDGTPIPPAVQGADANRHEPCSH